MSCRHGLPLLDCWDRVLPHLQNCSATLVMLGAPPTQSPGEHQFLFDAIDAHRPGTLRESARENLRRKLASARGVRVGCRVHAEAGLVALDVHVHLRGAGPPEGMQEITAAFVSAQFTFPGC